MLNKIIIVCLSYTLVATAPAPEIDYHGFNLDGYSLFKSQALTAPLYTEPILKGYPEPLYSSPQIKEPYIPAPVYAPAAPIFKIPAPVYAAPPAPIFKVPTPIYAAPILKEAAPIYAPAQIYKAAVPVVKAVAPVIKAVAPATSYASITRYHISHAPVIKAVVPAAPVLKAIPYDHSYGYH